MKSRLAVSLLSILIASSFASDAAAAFEKLKSWTGKVCGRYAVQVCNRLTLRDPALMSAIKCSNRDGVTMIHRDGDRVLLGQNSATANMQGVVFKLVGSDYRNKSLEFITTATRQIHEVLWLMGIK
ncbi:MAG: hypothetical protein DMG88_04870 [Acidobacteria bacterium]|nr:MAG: hypothetical protein DMG88_04870 [Acidobacteriota bacterium]